MLLISFNQVFLVIVNIRNNIRQILFKLDFYILNFINKDIIKIYYKNKYIFNNT